MAKIISYLLANPIFLPVNLTYLEVLSLHSLLPVKDLPSYEHSILIIKNL